MNKEIKAKYQSIIKSNEVLQSNKTVYENDDVTKKQVIYYDTGVKEIRQLISTTQLTTNEVTQHKNETKLELKTDSQPLLIGLICLANETNDKELLGQVKKYKKNMSRIDDKSFGLFIDWLIPQLETNAEQLVPFKITAEMISAFKTKGLKYIDLVNEPQRIINRRKKAAANLNEIIESLWGFASNNLDFIIMNYEKSAPVFVENYFLAREVPKPNQHHFAVIGFVTNKDSKEPVKYGTVTVVELDKKYKMSEKGRFAFKTLPEGEYTLRFEHMNFQTHEMVIQRYKQEYLRLNVELEPNPVPEEKK